MRTTERPYRTVGYGVAVDELFGIGCFANSRALCSMHAKAIALEWRLSLLADDIELIVSELVTNAIRAAGLARDDILAPSVVRLSIVSDLRCVLIRVWDGNSQIPARRDAGPDEEDGRGLMLVENLCSEWGACRKADGKVVWVLIG
jgi:anti-sigma regulatory factor (Ser/Thr protein kinase)